MSTLERLQAWYIANCDGDWEHRHGISIESCDNPGWWVKIDLTGTSLAQRPFLQVSENVDERRFQTGPCWFCCVVENGIWNGSGDETSLERILTTFLEWSDRPEA